MRHNNDSQFLFKIGILAVFFIMLLIIVVSVVGSIRQNKINTPNSISLNNKKRLDSTLLPTITTYQTMPNIGTYVYNETTGNGTMTGFVNVGIIDNGDGSTAGCTFNVGTNVWSMAVATNDLTIPASAPLAPVGIFGFPSVSDISYIAYGPYVDATNTLPMIPNQLSGASYATGCSTWGKTGTPTPYRDSIGAWDATQLWVAQIQPNNKPWAMVTNTGAQIAISANSMGTCSGLGIQEKHNDADIIMSCLPIGIMSFSPYPSNNSLVKEASTISVSPDILVGLGVLGASSGCPTDNTGKALVNASQPIIYLWYQSGLIGLQPCLTTIVDGAQGLGQISMPSVTCTSTVPGMSDYLKTMSATTTNVGIAPTCANNTPTCLSTNAMPQCVANSAFVQTACNTDETIVICEGTPAVLSVNSFFPGQFISIQAQPQQGNGYVQILPSGKEWVNPNALYTDVLADSSYQFLVGNVGSGTLYLSSPPTQLTIATLQSVKYPDLYLSVTPQLIDGGEYGQFTASKVTANFKDYSLEFIQNDADTMFWSQNGTGWWDGESRAFKAFVSLDPNNSTLVQMGGGVNPSPFIFKELPIPFCNNSYTGGTCGGGWDIAISPVDKCLAPDNFTYGDLCISGYGACGYPIPSAPPSFLTLGFKIISNYMYVWGYRTTISAGVFFSEICRCKIMYDTTTDGGIAGPNTSVEIDTTFGGNSTGWYSIAGSIDFLDVVNFGYGPLVIWSATTSIVDRMAQLSTVTIQIVDHSTYTTSNNTINTIPISLFTREPSIQAKIISYKETLENTWIPMLTGCLCTTTPRGIWLIGDVLQKQYGTDLRFSTIEQELEQPGQQYFELFISDQLLFLGPPGFDPQFSPNLNSTAAASGCWIATLEHIAAGKNPVCADGVNFVSADNLTPRPVFLNYNYRYVVKYSGTTMTLMNTGPMSPYTIAGTKTGYDVSTTTYLGIMGVGNPSKIIAPGGGMRVPHWLQLDAVPERPDSVNTCDDFPDVPWQVRHYLYTVTSLYIDPAGVVKNEPVDIKYTPTTNLWDLSCGLNITAPNIYLPEVVITATTDQNWPLSHWFIQHVLVSGSPQVVKSVSLSCTLTDLGSVSNYSYTSDSPSWSTYNLPENLFPGSVTYYMQMSFTDFAGRNHINTQEYIDPNGMAGDIMNIANYIVPVTVSDNLSNLSNLTVYDSVAYNTYDDMRRFDGALAQIILGTYASAYPYGQPYNGHFIGTWESTYDYTGPALTNLPTAIHALQFVDGNQYTPGWSGVGIIGNYATVCNQTFFMPGALDDSGYISTIVGNPLPIPGMSINSLDCMTFNGCTYDQYGNPYFNHNMVMFYTAEDLTTKFVIGGCWYNTPPPGMTTAYYDYPIEPAIYLS